MARKERRKLEIKEGRFLRIFPLFPKFDWAGIWRNAKWTILGLLLGGTLGATAATVTIIDQVLDNVKAKSVPGFLWLRWDNTIVQMFSEPECWKMLDEELSTGRPLQDWAPLRDLIGKAFAKFPPQPLTTVERTDCNLPPLVAGNSPDGSTITYPSTGTLVTKDGGKWTFGPATASGGNDLLLNGNSVAGFGVSMYILNGGQLYTFTKNSSWYLWAGTWQFQSTPPTVIPPPVAVTLPPVVTPPPVVPPAVVWKVAPNGVATTRPLYDAALWLATQVTWKQIGTVGIGAACEPEVIRPSTFHYTTNAAGVRGLASCAQVK